MTARKTSSTGKARLRPTVLTGLGIDEATDPAEVETTTASVLDYLAAAPPELAGWADAQASQVREAAGALSVGAVLHRDDDVAEQQTPAMVAHTPAPPRRRRRLSISPALLALIFIPLLIWGVYQLDAQPDTGPNSATAASPTATAPGPDPQLVKSLEARVEKNPKDYAAMSELGKLAIASGDFRGAATWQQQILADRPNDADARLALGVALFNAGDLQGAETQWTRVTTAAPNEAEAWYNLGFLYLSEKDPDMAKVERTWAKVVELDPDSNLAKTVESHLSEIGKDATESSP